MQSVTILYLTFLVLGIYDAPEPTSVIQWVVLGLAILFSHLHAFRDIVRGLK